MNMLFGPRLFPDEHLPQFVADMRKEAANFIGTILAQKGLIKNR